ncbi:hypothetical protein U1Q18_050244 [Sarracenia purpurea var. burkii]
MVGMCYLSPTVTKCITKGAKENSVFVYSILYWNFNNLCQQPKQIDYDFSTTPATDKEKEKIAISSTPIAKEKKHVRFEQSSPLGTLSDSAISVEMIKEDIKSAETPSSSSLVASTSTANQEKGLVDSFIDWIRGWFRK